MLPKGYKADSDGHIYDFAGNRVKEFRDAKGYLKVSFGYGRARRQYFVHRIIAEELVPKTSPEETVVIHRNGIRTDNRDENLSWMTPKTAKQTAHKDGYYKDHLVKLHEELQKKIEMTKGEEVTIFGSLIEAAAYLKRDNPGLPDIISIRSNISTALNKENRTAYGFKWREVRC